MSGTACLQIIPSVDVGIVMLTNGGPAGAAEAIVRQFLDIVQYGAPTRDWLDGFRRLTSGYYDRVGDLVGADPPGNPRPARALGAYAGRYGNAHFGPAEVTAEGEGLVLRLGPRGDRFQLTHRDGDVFAMSPLGENAPKGSRSSVRFSMRDGAIGGFTVDDLDANG